MSHWMEYFSKWTVHIARVHFFFFHQWSCRIFRGEGKVRDLDLNDTSLPFQERRTIENQVPCLGCCGADNKISLLAQVSFLQKKSEPRIAGPTITKRFQTHMSSSQENTSGPTFGLHVLVFIGIVCAIEHRKSSTECFHHSLI